MRILIVKFLCVLFLLLSFAHAEEDVSVETNPRNPVKGEVFEILFKCKSADGNEPVIDFRPDGLEILGKQIQGLSTRTVYNMGKITTQRELLVSFEARAPKAGRVFLRDVVVKIDGKTITEKEVPIQVMDEPVEPKVVFLAAEVPQKSVYAGEGITIRYYLYRKAQTHVQGYEIKKFSKLEGFMKRFIQENENPQRVTVDGESFVRHTVYTARIYPEKAGKLTVDPMEVSATYSQDTFGSMAFGFGLGMRDAKTRQFTSDPIEVNVKPLPEGKPASFTGLVGRHQMELKVSRSQVLVNEPLDVKVTVSGPGNLENMESPVIWNEVQLEKFESKADLNMAGTENAVKNFDYTFLGKNPGTIPSKVFELSYFDPNVGKYETIKRTLPEIIVAGNAQVARETPPPGQPPVESAAENSLGLVVDSGAWWNQMSFWWTLLSTVLLVLMGWQVYQWRSRPQTKEDWKMSYDKLVRGEAGIAELLKLIYALNSNGTMSAMEIIRTSGLNEASKKYFLDLLETLGVQEYGPSGPRSQIKVDPGHLKNLRQVLRG